MSMAIKYNMKKKAKGGESACDEHGLKMCPDCCMADGGSVPDDKFGKDIEPGDSPVPSPTPSVSPSPTPSVSDRKQRAADAMKNAFYGAKKPPAVATDEDGYAEGGFVAKEKASGYHSMPNPPDVYDPEAIELSERRLNQHGELERGPEGSEDGMDPGERLVNHMIPNQSHSGADMVGHIMKKRQMKFAHGGEAKSPNEMDEEEYRENQDLRRNEDWEKFDDRKYDEEKENYAHGDMVRGIMKKRYSKGGQVANDVGDGQDADKKENQFDDLVLRDDLEEHYTGANSGDELDNAGEDERRRDIVAKIMKSRKLKDRLPRPA